MIKKTIILITLSLFLFVSCKNESVQADNMLNSGVTYSDTLDNPSGFMNGNWERFYSDSRKNRFICLKGISKTNVLNQIEEFSQLNGKGETEYVYGIYSDNDWVYVKIPNDHNAYSFHNLTYWFLGTSNTDPLSSKESVGLFIGDKSYCIYNDYDLRNKYEVLDVLFLTSASGVRELVSIPFDVVVTDEEELIPSYSQVLEKFNLTEAEIKKAEYENVSFYYPE